MKLVTVSQMQAIEKEADAGGLAYDQMMENAGQGLADIIRDIFEGDEELEAVGGLEDDGGDPGPLCDGVRIDTIRLALLRSGGARGE